MTSAISVKDRLKRLATASGKTMQDALTAYGLERTVYRLSVSEYSERFTLKGGIFLYALFDGEFARATRDIDLLARNLPNGAEEMRKVFEDIFSIKCDDALYYDILDKEPQVRMHPFQQDNRDGLRQGRTRAGTCPDDFL